MYRIAKRLLDLTVATICLLILSPLLIPISLALRFTAEGEIFYGQRRVGYKNQDFKIWKFATMLKNSPNMKGGEITLRNDPRVTPVGRYLRITKLNEVPQILNVLIGNMSLVGPRPLMRVSFEKYTPEVRSKVYDSVPGITGIGSLVFRDEEKLVSESGVDPQTFYEDYIYPYKGQLEMWYRDHRSFSTDLIIIFLTAWTVIFPTSQLVFTIFRDLPARPAFLLKME